MIEPIVGKEGILEIFGLGPARSPGCGVFKMIREIPPAHYLMYKNGYLRIRGYRKLESKPHNETLDETVEHTRGLLVDAIERQLNADVPVCTFLSGGPDSSAISAVAANHFKAEGKGILHTYSIDYADNDKYFKANEFQPNSDGEWAKLMAGRIGSSHHNIMINTPQLSSALRDAILSNTFPWSTSVNARRQILLEEFKNLPLEEYVQEKYIQTIKEVPRLEGETAFEHRMRELFYLNIKWFMITLLSMGKILWEAMVWAAYDRASINSIFDSNEYMA